MMRRWFLKWYEPVLLGNLLTIRPYQEIYKCLGTRLGITKGVEVQLTSKLVVSFLDGLSRWLHPVHGNCANRTILCIAESQVSYGLITAGYGRSDLGIAAG